MSTDLTEITGDEIKLLDRGYEYVRKYLKERGKARRDKTDGEIMLMGFSRSFCQVYRSMEDGYWAKKKEKGYSIDSAPIRVFENS